MVSSRYVPLVGLFLVGEISIASGEVDFARDIQPILNANCTECHGGVKAAGDVSFVYEERVIDFIGDSGNPVVKPGDAERSEIIYRITTDDEDDKMPPPEDHEALSPDEIALIKQWIDEGAVWSGHWAFRTPEKPDAPETSFEVSARGDIDRFIFNRLEREDLEPNGLEEPGRLLRRMSMGLTGLPPTLGELSAFEEAYSANRDQALENAVDALLDRPAFGERWASMWLDLVRYADSGGLGQDQKRTIWAYRDWVVKAFNEDLPFDAFTVKQLAGDLLPNPSLDDLVATACQRNTQTNDEGGTDDEAFRVEAVIDRINTTWQTWGSITFSCVQCHDHPYDPLRNEEYYRFMDFYNQTADSDLQDDRPLVKVPSDAKRHYEALEMRRRILALKESIWEEGVDLRDGVEWRGARGLALSTNNSTTYDVVESPIRDEFHTVGTVETKTHTIIDATREGLGNEPVTALQLAVLPWDVDAATHSPEWGFLVAKIEAWVLGEGDAKEPIAFRWNVPDVAWMPTDPMGDIGNDGSNWGADSRIHYERRIVLVPENPIALGEGERLRLHIHCNKTGHGSHPMAIQRGYLEVSSDDRWNRIGQSESDLGAKKNELAELSKEYSAIEGTTVPIMARRPEFLERPTHVFERGNALEKGDLKTAGLPASLLKAASASESPNRLEMARWWVSDDHPLTARVFVNRLWEQMFGVGIVPTLEDFGSAGERPTHPELLDYLAVRFQEDYDWSVKSILKEIALSHVYLQSSKAEPELWERDADNRLLARGPRLRLSAEMVRDQALAASGLISSKLGGPPVHPPLPEGVWRPFQSRDKWETPEEGNADRYRRSLYTYVKRSIPFPTFASFDAPSREFCNPRRLKSNTPLQALMTLNDEAFVECAQALGSELESIDAASDRERLAVGYRLATGRIADEIRIGKLRELLENTKNDQAWTVVGQVLLNLDDALTY